MRVRRGLAAIAGLLAMAFAVSADTVVMKNGDRLTGIVEVSDGKKHAIHAGDIVFLEDLQGKGHITRILSPVTNIFIRVPDSFDVIKWSRGEA